MNLLFAESEARIMYQESISISEELYFIQRQIGQCFSECKMAIADASKMTTYEARLYGEAEDGKPSIFKRIWEKIKSILKTIIKYILKFVNGVLGLLNKVFGTSWKVVIKSVNGDGESSSGGGGGSSGGSSGSSDSGSKPADDNKPSDNPAPQTPTHDNNTFIGKFMNATSLGNALKEIDSVLPGFNEKVISDKDILDPLAIINKFTGMIKGRNANLGLDIESTKKDMVVLMRDIFSNNSENMSRKNDKGDIVQMNDGNKDAKTSANIDDNGELDTNEYKAAGKIVVLMDKMSRMQNEILNTHHTIIKYADTILNTKTLDNTNSPAKIKAENDRAKAILETYGLNFAFSEKESEENTLKLVMASLQDASGDTHANALKPILSKIYGGKGESNISNIFPEADMKTRIVNEFTFDSNLKSGSDINEALIFHTKHSFAQILLDIYTEGFTNDIYTRIDKIIEQAEHLPNKNTNSHDNLYADLPAIKATMAKLNTLRTKNNKNLKLDKDMVKEGITAVQSLAKALSSDTSANNKMGFEENNGTWTNSQHKITAKSTELSLADLMVNDTWFDNAMLTQKLNGIIVNYKNEIKSIDEEKPIFNGMNKSNQENMGEINDAYRNEITKILKDTVSDLQKTSVETNKYIMLIYRASISLSAVRYNNSLMRYIPQYQAQAMAYTIIHNAYETFVKENNEALKGNETFVQKNREIETAHNEFVSKLRIL